MVRTKSTKFAYISTSQFVERTQVCNLTVCGGRFAQTNIEWTRLHRQPRFRMQTIALTQTSTNFCSVPTVMETWPRRNQIDGHAWNDNNWHRRRRLSWTREAQPIANCFLGNLHYSPYLCEFTAVVIRLLTLTNTTLVDVGISITWTSHGLDSHALPQVDICSSFMKRLGMVADLLLKPFWCL